MLIAQTSNIFPMGPTKAYGGERIVYYLCQALKNLGHEVVFFGAPQNDVPLGVEHVSIPPIEACERDPHPMAVKDWEARHSRHFDVFQCNYFGSKWDPTVCRDWNYCELVWCSWSHTKDQLRDPHNTVCYSRALQRDMQQTDRPATLIYYGIPMENYQVDPRPPLPYVVWIGKIEGGKGCDWAIDAALAADMKIVLMGPPYNSGHFQNDVAPKFADPRVIWLRGCTDEMKRKVFSRATAFLSTNVDGWGEHFGIVNIEAMASGCPVLGWNRKPPHAQSAVVYDEIIEPGKNGHVIEYTTSRSPDEYRRVVGQVADLLKSGKVSVMDRQVVRRTIVDRFSAELMAKRFLWYYKQIQGHQKIIMTEVPEKL